MTIALTARRAVRLMPWLLALYAAASFLHFTHNAEYLARYPNLPASWTRADLYLAWCAVTTVGLLGYALYLGRYQRAGLTVLAIYGGLGLSGLLHYTRAPISHHSAVMNITILTEAAAAGLFMINVARVAACHTRLRPDGRLTIVETDGP